MPKEVMRRQASDNEYLHKDFHGALSCALIYLEENFGPDAVRDYLRTFARRYYAPVSEDLQERGLQAMADRLRRIYDIEGGEVEITLSDDEMMVRVEACPAVTHMRENDYPVSPMWRETIRCVHEAICEGTAFDFDLMDFDKRTGASTQRFYRREGAASPEEGSA
ncbi:MAG: hypothetical protein U9R79_10645 [Armatimonadota bacterium]|nr:hypothetical protein [Armatimonadota bacterium]